MPLVEKVDRERVAQLPLFLVGNRGWVSIHCLTGIWTNYNTVRNQQWTFWVVKLSAVAHFDSRFASPAQRRCSEPSATVQWCCRQTPRHSALMWAAPSWKMQVRPWRASIDSLKHGETCLLNTNHKNHWPSTQHDVNLHPSPAHVLALRSLRMCFSGYCNPAVQNDTKRDTGTDGTVFLAVFSAKTPWS